MADQGTIQVAPQDPCASQTPPELRNLHISLEPLRDEGPDSLLPEATPGILEVKLTKLVTASPADLHHITTITSDDVFQDSEIDPKRRSLIPAGHRILDAILAFLFRDSAIPHTVQLSPPARIPPVPGDAPRITPFLRCHKFLNLLFITLAISAALLPDLDDDNTDDDDPDDEYPHHYLPL